MKNYLVLELAPEVALHISETVVQFPSEPSVTVSSQGSSFTVRVKEMTLADPARVQFDPFTLMAAGMYGVRPEDVTPAQHLSARLQARRAEEAYANAPRKRISVTEINITSKA